MAYLRLATITHCAENDTNEWREWARLPIALSDVTATRCYRKYGGSNDPSMLLTGTRRPKNPY
jgi:hypothetical protein